MFAFEMVGISIAMGPAWAWIDRGIEYPVMLGLVAVYLAARGGGRWSVDSSSSTAAPTQAQLGKRPGITS